MKDTQAIIEDARKAGVDMSWLADKKQKRTKQSVPDSMSPGAAGLLGAIREDHAMQPAYQPRPPGTPTLAREQFQEGVRQWEEEFDWERDVWQKAWQRDQERYERERDLQERQLAGQMADAAVPGATGEYNWYDELTVSRQQETGPNIAAKEIDNMVSRAAQEGAGWEEIRDHLTSHDTMIGLSRFFVDQDFVTRVAADSAIKTLEQMVKERPRPNIADPLGMKGIIDAFQARVNLQKQIRKAREDRRKILGETEEDAAGI